MTQHSYSRQIEFEAVLNFRDLGGYPAAGGRTVAWRRLFRSGNLHHATGNDLKRLKDEIRLASVIDLRSDLETGRQAAGPLSASGIKYHHIPFLGDGGERTANEERYRNFTSMGEFYIHLIRQKEFGKRIIEALEVIAVPENLPLIFHCAAGKDRTGILAAILLSLLGVTDIDIIDDYTISAAYMEIMRNQPGVPESAQNLPDYFWEAKSQSMSLFLSTVKQEYGSSGGYLEAQGAEASLLQSLEKALLVR